MKENALAHILYFPDRFVAFRRDIAKELDVNSKQGIENILKPLNQFFIENGGKQPGRQCKKSKNDIVSYEVDFIDQSNNLFVVNKYSLDEPKGIFTGIAHYHKKPIPKELIEELSDFYKNDEKTSISFTENDVRLNDELKLHLMRFPPISGYFMEHQF